MAMFSLLFCPKSITTNEARNLVNELHGGDSGGAPGV